MNTAVLIDVSNLSYCVGQVHKRKVDFEKLITDCRSRYGEDLTIIAYVKQKTNEAQGFVKFLQGLSILVKINTSRSTYFSWSCGMAIDAIQMSKMIGTVVFCSSDRGLKPLITWLREQGHPVDIYAEGIPFDLVSVATKAFFNKDILGDEVPQKENSEPN